MNLDKLKTKAAEIDTTVRIGKKGLSESTITEIKKQLKAKKLIKIKMLNNFISGKDKSEIIDKIIQNTGAILVAKRGFVISIYKR